MEVSGQLHPREEDLPVPICKEAGWVPEPIWTRSGTEHFLHCTCWESNPDCPAHSLVTVLTEPYHICDNGVCLVTTELILKEGRLQVSNPNLYISLCSVFFFLSALEIQSK
jgi:hypothetical protein